MRWFKAQPSQSKWPGFPFGWVEANLGPKEPPVGTKAQIFDNFGVVVVDKHIEAEYAEDSVLEFCTALEGVLDNDVTIGGLVACSYVTNREKDKFFDKDYSVAAVRVTLSTRRRE